MAASACSGGRNLAKLSEMFGEYLRTCKGLDSLLKNGRLVSVESGRVVYEAEVREEHTNRGGTMHGGFAALLVDSLTGVAIISKAQFKHENPLYAGVSVALSVNFLRAAKKDETIVVSAAVDKVGRTLAFTSCEIRSKADNALLVTGSHTKFIG